MMESLPRPVEAVLFDAGGVLLDLDYGYLRRLIETPELSVSEKELSRLEAIARMEINSHVQSGGRVSETWRDYFHVILARAGVTVDRQGAIIDTLWEAHERFGLWTVALPGAKETVSILKERGYRIGVVSNAEGRVATDLAAAGFGAFLETVVDSHLVGVEKPSPGIFEIALERMGIQARSSVFLGDVPAVDVQGARAAGLTPILLDRHDLYPDVDAMRLRSIEELPAYLDNSESD
jgi:putative hydrolase of the HAD superfamily